MSHEVSALTHELWFKLNAARATIKALSDCHPEASDFHQGLTTATCDAIESAFPLLQGLEHHLQRLNAPSPHTIPPKG